MVSNMGTVGGVGVGRELGRERVNGGGQVKQSWSREPWPPLNTEVSGGPST